MAEATGPAIPFYLGIAVQRPRLRPLLTEWLIVVTWVVWGSDPENRETADLPEVASVRAAMEAGKAAFGAILDDDSPTVRGRAAFILGHCQLDRTVVDGWLWSRFQIERDVDAQVDLLIAMAKVAQGVDRLEELLDVIDAWLSNTDPRRQCAAAHAWFIADPSSPEAARTLINWMHGSLEPNLGLTRDSEYDYAVDRTLEYLDDAVLQPAVLEVILNAVATDPDRCDYLLRIVLDQAFSPRLRIDDLGVASLTPPQKQVVEFLASGQVSFNEYILYLLPRLGLPTDPERLRELGAA